MGLKINEIKQARRQYKWGEAVNQLLSNEKNKRKECGPLTMQDRNFFNLSLKNPANQTIVDIPEEVLNELMQLNPRDIANILVNS